MKLNKGKVHPSPSSSTTASPPPITANDTLNNLLPTAILTLISILSLQEKEVLAYMITHSLSSSTATNTAAKTTTAKKHTAKKPNNATSTITNNNRSSTQAQARGGAHQHKVPCFECGCFDCYTSYWFRWDSSPNRELIHQAIEAFEEHLTTSEQQKNKKKNKVNKRVATVANDGSTPASPPPPTAEILALPEVVVTAEIPSDDVAESGVQQEQEVSIVQAQQQQQHKGLARKVLPDVIGLFNSRLWNLWGPNV